ncbi:hypothetical protein BaRGS_00025592, partial [Batillaria attramentaria]
MHKEFTPTLLYDQNTLSFSEQISSVCKAITNLCPQDCFHVQISFLVNSNGGWERLES